MKMKRKLLALLISTFVLTGSLAGCKPKTETPTPETPAPTTETPATETPAPTDDKKVSIDIFQFKVEFKDTFEELAKAYQTEHPNVTVNITTVGGGDDYGAALKTKFNSGNEPAIFNVGGPQDVADWKSKLADLSDTKAAKAAIPYTTAPVTTDGKVFALPYNQEGYGLIYNKSIFEKAGIDPSGITSFAKLEEAVKTLDSKKKDLGLDAVFALPAKETWVTGLHLSNPFFAAEFGDIEKAFTAKTIDFTYNDAMKKLVDLQNTYSVQPTVSLDYSTQVEKEFSMGKVAMIQQGNWVIGSIEGIDPALAKDGIDILPMPVVGYKEDCIPVGVPNYWAVNSSLAPEVQQASKDFIDWIYTSDTGKSFVLDKFKFIPAYTGFDESKISDPLSKAVYRYAQSGKTINWVFMGYPSDWGMNQLGQDIQKYVDGKMKWSELVDHAKSSWSDARK